MASLTTARTIAQLVASKHGPLADVGFDKPQRVHMRQSELDGACGQHALLMATVGMGLWTRRELMMRRRNKVFAQGKLWAVLEQWHFVGTRVEQLAEALDTVGGFVRYQVSRGASAKVAAFAASSVRRGRFTALRVQGAGQSLDHWILAVGLEVTGGAPKALLALDSNQERPQIGVYNVRVELPAGRRRCWVEMRTIDGSQRTVAFHSALAMWRRT
jgi:hypothetical protein